MNLAYKHLNTKLKIGEFTVGQWAVVFIGLLLMLTWGFYLSPFSPYLTLITAVYLGGVPISLAFLSTLAELNLWRFGKSAWEWGVAHGRYAPGPGAPSKGYTIVPDPRAQRSLDRLGSGP